MALLERLVLALELDANGAVSKAQQFQQEIGRALTPVEKLQQQLKLGFNVGLGAAGAASAVDLAKQAVGAVAQQAGAAVKAQSDLNEQVSRSGVVFGSSARSIASFADQANKIGLSQRAALEATATFGALFQTLGQTDEQSAKYSTTLTKLASDLASFSNTSVDDAVAALRSGLSGEIEPLRRYGVFLSDANLRQRAFNQGIYDGTGILTSAQRAQAAYAEILDQTRKAQGDFERTSGGLANQQRILAANIENLQAQFGAALVPSLARATSALNSLEPQISAGIDAWNLYNGAIGDTVGSVGEFVSTAPGVGSALRSISDGLAFNRGTALADSIQRLSPYADDASAALTRVRAAVFGVLGVTDPATVKVSGLAASFEEATFKVADFSSVLSAAFGVFDAQNGFDSALASLTDAQTSGGAAAKQRALSEFEIESAARSVKQAEEDLADAEKNLADIRKGASEDEKRRAEQEVANAAQRSRVASVRLAEAENNLRRASARGTVAEQTKAQLEYEQAVLDVQNATQDAADAQKQKIDVDNRGKQGSKELADAVKRVEDAQWAVKSAYESQRRLFEQDAATGGPGAKVGRSMESAFLSAQKAAGNIVDEMLKAGKPIDEITAKARELEAANIAAGQAAGLPESLLTKASAYYDYLVALAKYQNYLNTTFKNGTDPDGFEGLYLKGLVDSAKDRFEGAGRAAGGSVAGGVLYRVNESRAEYFKPNGSGTIVPLTSGGGMGGTYNFDFSGAVIATDSDLERLIIDTLERARRRGWN